MNLNKVTGSPEPVFEEAYEEEDEEIPEEPVFIEVPMDICEAEYTIHDGGVIVGMPALVIKMAGCNLHCTWCFGAKGGDDQNGKYHSIPTLCPPYKPAISIHKVKIGDVVLTYDENLKLVETTVMNVLTREVDEWLEVIISGKKYFVTPEHPFFTTRGLVVAEELKLGDMIIHSTPKDKVSYCKLGDRNPMRNAEVLSRKLEHTNYKVVGEKIHNTLQSQIERGEYIHAFSRLTKEQKDEARRKLSESKLGSNNPNWNGGKYKNYHILKDMIQEGVYTKCKLCDAICSEVHHLDGNQDNDDLSNLTVVCHKCHSKIHKRGNNFWMNPRKDGIQPSVELDFRMLELNGLEVNKITRINNSEQRLTVYNFECSPYNTYLIDYMWVHNCDVVKKKIDRAYNTNSVIPLLVNYADIDLIITGGEPFIQPEALGYLINVGLDARREFGYTTNVVVETNGTISPEILRRTMLEKSRVSEEKLNSVVWSINPKLHSSHEEWSKTRFVDFMNFQNVQIRLTVNPFDADDLSDLRRIVSLIPNNIHIVVQPVVQDLESYDHEAYHRSLHELYKIVIDERLSRVRIIPQIHKMIWGMRKESI